LISFVIPGQNNESLANLNVMLLHHYEHGVNNQAISLATFQELQYDPS
jgi:hypothetical protein